MEIEARSLIRTVPIITKLDNYILKDIDWIFFSSKNAVEYFFNLQPLLPEKVKFGVMGSGSEEMLRRKGYYVDYTGVGIDTADVADDFARLATGQTVLFPSAENSMRSIQLGLSADTKVIDLPIYATILDDDVEPTGAEILIFTSPSNAGGVFCR